MQSMCWPTQAGPPKAPQRFGDGAAGQQQMGMLLFMVGLPSAAPLNPMLVK